jgi:hypothetical protein
MRPSNKIVREATKQESVVRMLLTFNASEPVGPSVENRYLRTVAVELPAEAGQGPDADSRIRISGYMDRKEGEFVGATSTCVNKLDIDAAAR